MKWLAPSYNQRPCFSFIFPGVSIYSVLLLYFLLDIWLLPIIITTCLALSFGISVHMAAFAWLGTQLFCSVLCMSLPVVAHGWLWSNLGQAPLWSFKHCFRSLDPLIWHPEYLHTDQNKRSRLGPWSPGLVFLCVATVAFREYPALLVWGGTGTLCKLYLSVPKWLHGNQMIKTLSYTVSGGLSAHLAFCAKSHVAIFNTYASVKPPTGIFSSAPHHSPLPAVKFKSSIMAGEKDSLSMMA